MAKKRDDIPDWVSDEIQNAKFEKPVELVRTGYILEIYSDDGKIDAQLYESVEDGRHIVTMDLPDSINSSDLEKGIVYEFKFNQSRAPLSNRVSEWLQAEKQIDMTTIYQFDLKSMEQLDVGSADSADDEE